MDRQKNRRILWYSVGGVIAIILIYIARHQFQPEIVRALPWSASDVRILHETVGFDYVIYLSAAVPLNRVDDYYRRLDLTPRPPQDPIFVWSSPAPWWDADAEKGVVYERTEGRETIRAKYENGRLYAILFRT